MHPFEYDPEEETFHGEVMHLADVVTFQGKSVDELKQAMAGSVVLSRTTLNCVMQWANVLKYRIQDLTAKSPIFSFLNTQILEIK